MFKFPKDLKKNCNKDLTKYIPQCADLKSLANENAGCLPMALCKTWNGLDWNGMDYGMELHVIISHALFAGVSMICLISAGTHKLWTYISAVSQNQFK